MAEHAEQMEMVPESVGRASRTWDEQHLDLHAAAGQVGQAVQGFTPVVAVAAQRFAGAWERLTEVAATRCEQQADALRDVMADWVATDRGISVSSYRLLPYVEEVR